MSRFTVETWTRISAIVSRLQGGFTRSVRSGSPLDRLCLGSKQLALSLAEVVSVLRVSLFSWLDAAQASHEASEKMPARYQD